LADLISTGNAGDWGDSIDSPQKIVYVACTVFPASAAGTVQFVLGPVPETGPCPCPSMYSW
jgi:hypothetical protein